MTAPALPLPGPRFPGRPTRCARGHPLTWLLSGGEDYAEGEALAACACSQRVANGRVKNGSVPTLWRWVPSSPLSLRPVFASQNRMAFALALNQYERGRIELAADREAVDAQAERVAKLARQAQDALLRISRQQAAYAQRDATRAATRQAQKQAIPGEGGF